MDKETRINTNLSLIQALLTAQGAEFHRDYDADGRPPLNGTPDVMISLTTPDKPGGVEPSTLAQGLADKLEGAKLNVSAYTDRDNSYRLIIEGEGLASPEMSQFLMAELARNLGQKQSIADSRRPSEGRG